VKSRCFSATFIKNIIHPQSDCSNNECMCGKEN
jgi:hypothetical protein